MIGDPAVRALLVIAAAILLLAAWWSISVQFGTRGPGAFIMRRRGRRG